MFAATYVFSTAAGWDLEPDSRLDSSQTLVLLFADADRKKSRIQEELVRVAGLFPNSVVMGCSTAGEIYSDELYDNSLVAAVIHFEHTRLKRVTRPIPSMHESREVGRQVASSLLADDLVAVFTLTDGLQLNGSAYVAGLDEVLPETVVTTGGMAADGERFQSTWVVAEGRSQSGMVVACGLYGDRIQVTHGSRGGWDLLGVDRRVTESRENVLFTLDGKPALALYKEYLGEMASGLPGSALLFPLAIRDGDTDGMTVRTVLAVDEERQSITFAGDVPEGARVCLMRANFDRLIAGAGEAVADMDLSGRGAGVCVAISCVGRRMVLGMRAEEELEAVNESLPDDTPVVGFYSYGEISPLVGAGCSLHNQTMTLTLFHEI